MIPAKCTRRVQGVVADFLAGHLPGCRWYRRPMGRRLNLIKSWLGRVSITTTSEYIEIDMRITGIR